MHPNLCQVSLVVPKTNLKRLQKRKRIKKLPLQSLALCPGFPDCLKRSVTSSMFTCLLCNNRNLTIVLFSNFRMSDGKMKFWRPGASAPEETILLDSGSGDKTATFNPNNNLSLSLQRQKLPIFQFRNHILWLVENFKTVVLVGETGCGKSTQIPQYLHEADWTSKGMVDYNFIKGTVSCRRSSGPTSES